MHARKITIGPAGVAVGSGVFGFAAGIATGAGVILVSLLLGAGLATPAVLATDALVSIVIDIAKAALFQRFDLLDAEAFFTGVVIGVASIPGSAIAALAGVAHGREAARAVHGSPDPVRRRLHALARVEMTMKELKGKVAAVTGAASGLGRSMALAFAAEGMDVALADVDEVNLSAVQEEVLAKGVRAITLKVDVSQAEQVEAFRDQTLTRLGGVHVVCNNAGVSPLGPVWENSVADWQWILGVNLWGVIHGVRAFAPHLIAQDEGHIVNTASVPGLISPPGSGAYNVTKHAVVALSEIAAPRPARAQLARRRLGAVPRLRAHRHRRTRSAAGRRSYRNFPKIAGNASRRQAMLRKAVTSGKVSADQVAQAVVAAVKEERFYILTHPRIKGAIQARMEDILQERAPRDPLARYAEPRSLARPAPPCGHR